MSDETVMISTRKMGRGWDNFIFQKHLYILNYVPLSILVYNEKNMQKKKHHVLSVFWCVFFLRDEMTFNIGNIQKHMFVFKDATYKEKK